MRVLVERGGGEEAGAVVGVETVEGVGFVVEVMVGVVCFCLVEVVSKGKEVCEGTVF